VLYCVKSLQLYIVSVFSTADHLYVIAVNVLLTLCDCVMHEFNAKTDDDDDTRGYTEYSTDGT
jgi:hypothetical protein